MDNFARPKVHSWGVVLILVVIVAGLGAVQYRWSREVSEAARTRMQSSLQLSLVNFRRDFSQELATIALAFQPDGERARGITGRSLAAKLHDWRRSAAHPDLISKIYIWNSPADDGPLYALADGRPQLAEVPWPAKFDALSHRLQNMQSPGPTGGPPFRISPRGQKASSSLSPNAPEPIPWAFSPGIPALIYRLPGSGDETAAFLIIGLSADALQLRVFPELARRYLADSEGMVYQVAVIGGTEDHPSIFFTSDPGFGELAHRRVDAELNLFGPPSLSPGSSFPPPPAGRSPRPAAPLAASTNLAPANIEPVRFFTLREGSTSTGWWVIAQHRKGSVEAAVAQLRRRDLALSFGVLLVLAFTMGLIVVTSQRARQLASLQMDFVAGVSHELRTPLAVISSAAENIVDGVVDDRQRVLQYGAAIRNQARQLSELIEQVLRFASTRKGAPHFNLRPLQVSEVVDAALESTASVVSESGFVVECEIEPALPPVKGDLGILSQCLQNLITNAVKYGGESRWIGIEGRLDPEAASPTVLISVEDHGLGVEPADLDHIFEAFYRSSSAADSPIHGTGLGLSLAKSFAEAMGGSLTVKSQVGKGTCFTVHLPVAGSRTSAPVVVAQASES